MKQPLVTRTDVVRQWNNSGKVVVEQQYRSRSELYDQSYGSTVVVQRSHDIGIVVQSFTTVIRYSSFSEPFCITCICTAVVLWL